MKQGDSKENFTKPSLRARFEEFILTVPGVISIDQLLAGRPSENDERADYLAEDWRVVIELKSLESDTENKVEELLKRHRERDEFPVFFGGWELPKILKHLPDGDAINNQILQKITTSVRKIFRKAHHQIGRTKDSFQIADAEGLLIILNERVEILTPDALVWTLRKIAHSKTQDGEYRYGHVRAAMIISEAHGKEISNDTLAHPIVLLNFENGPRPFPKEFLDRLDLAWAEFNGAEFISHEGEYKSFQDLDFVRITDLHRAKRTHLRRYEAWVRYYERNPYFRSFDDEHLKWFFNTIMHEVGRGMLKGGTEGERDRAKYFWMEVFTHFMEEVRYRAIDLRYFTSDERAWRDLDRLMAERFDDFEIPKRSWADDWRAKKRKG